ncbi:Uncharacterized protein dnm_082480 [Desulfonema magnum]|uniref:Uncharacterized protein n=1 Tax=Desulfonema magnum TaxID=45655 RepID=A0A975GSQ9_9BACT|nr:Uncharacterized protein dnm_082480 [Desulfonema magnum]
MSVIKSDILYNMQFQEVMTEYAFAFLMRKIFVHFQML